MEFTPCLLFFLREGVPSYRKYDENLQWVLVVDVLIHYVSVYVLDTLRQCIRT